MAIIGTLGAAVTLDTSDFERGMERTRRDIERTNASVTAAARQLRSTLADKITFGVIGT